MSRLCDELCDVNLEDDLLCDQDTTTTTTTKSTVFLHTHTILLHFEQEWNHQKEKDKKTL